MDQHFLERINRLSNSLNLDQNIKRKIVNLYYNLNQHLRIVFYSSIDPNYFENRESLVNYITNLENRLNHSPQGQHGSILSTYVQTIHDNYMQRQREEAFRNRMEMIRPDSVFRSLTSTNIPRKEIEVLGLEDYVEPDVLPDCAICLEPIKKRKGGRLHSYTNEDHKVNQCGHMFHRRCLREMLDRPGPSNLRCPMCRAEIDAGSTFFGSCSDLDYLKKLKIK